jgi:predicted ATP-grasp superfamily ATP-dependent carboligase
VFPSSVEEAVGLGESLRFPRVIKPRSHVAVGWARGHVVRDRGELARSYASHPIGASYRALVERYPGLGWPMLQEYVPGATENTFSVSGLLAQDGRLVAASASRKLQQWPPDLGVGVVFESVAGDELVAVGARVAQQVLGAGLFEIELILERTTGRYLAIDLNPRAFGQITLDIARGIDLPRLWYESFFRAAAAGDAAPVARARADVRWRHFWPFHVGQLAAIVAGPGRGRKLADYARQVSEPHVDIANDWADPLPNVVFALHLWRHPGGLVRPFLNGVGGGRGHA